MFELRVGRRAAWWLCGRLTGMGAMSPARELLTGNPMLQVAAEDPHEMDLAWSYLVGNLANL